MLPLAWQEVLEPLAVTYVASHPNSGVVLQRLWPLNRDLLLRAMAALYQKDASNIARVLDVCQVRAPAASPAGATSTNSSCCLGSPRPSLSCCVHSCWAQAALLPAMRRTGCALEAPCLLLCIPGAVPSAGGSGQPSVARAVPPPPPPPPCRSSRA